MSLPAGRWSRRSSLAGNEFFKMEDEVKIEFTEITNVTALQCYNVQMLQMVQVHRSGSVVSIPRKLSHHVPIVPILESQDYDRKGFIYFSSASEGTSPSRARCCGTEGLVID